MKTALIFLGLFAFVAAQEIDLDAVQQEVQKAPLVEVQSDAKPKACRCDAVECVCCAAPKLWGTTLSGCIHFSFDTNDKRIHITVKALKNTIVKTSFSTARFEHVCGRLPKRASILGYCLNTDTTKSPQGVLCSCSTLDILVKETVAATVTFTCINIDKGKISFGGLGQSANDSPIKIRVRNPLKIAVDFIRNLFHKKPNKN